MVANQQQSKSEPPPSFTPVDGPSIVRFGRYEIIGEIGSGGMGSVFRAKQVGLDRITAVKVLRPEQYEAFAGTPRWNVFAPSSRWA